jgi:putative transposase
LGDAVVERPTQPGKKVKHYDLPGDAHYLTFSCYGGLPLLSKDRSRLWFIDALKKARAKHAFDLWAWVIMPEHAHLLIFPRAAKYKTSKILASVKKPVGYKAVQYLRQNAPSFLERLTVRTRNRTYRRFWQAGPGHDGNLYELEAVYNAIGYIHNNPVRRGLVDHPTDWLWSSARDWAGMGHPYITVDRTLPPLHPYVQ